MKIVMRDPAELIPAEYNPRKLSDKQKADIKASLTEFGFADPIVVNKHKDRMDVIIGGHQRCIVAQEMGTKEVPTVEMKLTLEKEKELNIRLNKNSGEFDIDMLSEFFNVDDLIDWGFEDYELGNDDNVNLEDFFEDSEPKEDKEDDEEKTQIVLDLSQEDYDSAMEFIEASGKSAEALFMDMVES